MSKLYRRKPASHKAVRDFRKAGLGPEEVAKKVANIKPKENSETMSKIKEDSHEKPFIYSGALGLGGAIQSFTYNLSLIDEPLKELKEFVVNTMGMGELCEG